MLAALETPARTRSTDGADESHELWGLVLEAARLDEVVDQAVRTLELSVLAKYAFAARRSSSTASTTAIRS